MAKVGAFIVGIGAYRAIGATGLSPLQFAVNDADAVERYLRTCWPGVGDLTFVRIPEDEATAAEIEIGLGSLAEGGPYELCWLFLSGHGWVDDATAGFLVQPAPGARSPPLLFAGTLDRLISKIDAKRTILVLDCCFAEALVRRMSFFAGLGPSDARLYIASSRESQRTWEDVGVQHGVFTAHLLDLLTTGSAAQFSERKTQLDVDAELFPALCTQVPLYVFQQKGGARQEPVKGGVSSSAVTLPVASLARRVQDRTVLETVAIRLRQAATGLAVGGLALLLLSYALFYYVEPGAGGTLIVRHGTRWLEPLLRALPLERVDTGISVADLSSNSAAAAPLQSGYTTGIWTHDGSDRSRGWFDAVLPGLDPAAAARYGTLAGRQPPILGASPAPLDVERAAWMTLSDGRPDGLDAILKHVPGGDRRSRDVAQVPANQMDFEILDLTEPNMVSYAEALKYSAALDPVKAFPAFLGFAKATQEWLIHNTDAQRGRGARDRVRVATTEILGVISRARIDRGLPALDPADQALLQALSGKGYAEVLGGALGRVVGDTQSRLLSATAALQRFHGNPDDPKQGPAFETIIAGLDDSALSKELVARVIAAFTGAGAVPNSYYTRFLIAAGDARALPANVVDELVATARERLGKTDSDFEDSEYARILAHAMTQIPPAHREPAFALIERIANSVTPMSMSTAEMYAALARQRLDPEGLLAKVRERAAKAKPYTPADPSVAVGPTPGMTIVVGPGPWVAALAVFGSNRQLGPEDVAILRAHVANPALRELIVPALVYQERAAAPDTVVGLWVARLAALATESRSRGTEQAIMAGYLAALPRPEFTLLLEQLRKKRAESQEPELRIALGAILVEAIIARSKVPPKGLQLFSG
ncbi:caspase family protein [Bradyrhizobium sp. NBAIM08]|uniref:caspase family protein n=1 Tax=Bradyrhizobium sp. NBAIM08 TaxID=2793815 RepID=UPI001CD3CAE0|nr:caspase family protein [Bradyrhizobium sp. NBAIM08]MCA1479854.1 caspase family protein [Bradyrhizobium sp. NBAIM08]